jgi:hypothetical protein
MLIRGWMQNIIKAREFSPIIEMEEKFINKRGEKYIKYIRRNLLEDLNLYN